MATRLRLRSELSLNRTVALTTSLVPARFDGVPVNSCLVALGQCAGREVTTVEGLGDAQHLSPLQEAMVTEGGAQCGICTPGMLLSAEALLREKAAPTDGEIREAIAGNVCRCTGYQRIVSAVVEAGKRREVRP